MDDTTEGKLKPKTIDLKLLKGFVKVAKNAQNVRNAALDSSMETAS